MASKGITTTSVNRGGQKINSAYPMDNTSGLPLPDTRGGSFRGGVDNLSHSLKGAQAVDAANPGAAGSLKHTIIADH